MTMDESGIRRLNSEINVTPMIDVLLVLLIIFMVIVPVTPKGELASAPPPAARGMAPPANPVVLEVARGSQGVANFSINRQPVSRQDLRARLEAIYANRAERVLFIRGDDQLSFAQIADAVDVGHAAGIERVGLLTPRAAGGF